jgi:hypothetical protein
MPQCVFSANAKKPNYHHHSRDIDLLSSIQYKNNYLIRLNQEQKGDLIDLLKGRNSNGYILSPSIRIEITNQRNSLPPGIQKKLAKGKPLPYGIAKKVILPQEINKHVNLSQDYKIIVLGSSVIVVSSLDNLILDILQDIF